LVVLLLVTALATGGRALASGDAFDQLTFRPDSGSLAGKTGLIVARQDATDELAPLRTVGGASPRISGESKQDIRSQGGSLLAGPGSAWQDLTRAERATLLDADAVWVPFDDLVAGDDARDDLLFPVFEFAWDLSDGAEFDDDLLVNTVLLDLPAAKLGPALEASERQAVAVGPAVVLLFDNVVVGRIDHAADAAWTETLDRGEIDQRGLIVPVGTATPLELGTSPTAAAQSPATESTQPVAPAREPKYSASGEDIPTVTLAELPVEAAETIYLILVGGPFPFDRDGVTFGNYEGHLPDADFGYYREYTVITPGLDHRGARRIVTGENDTVFYYTDDHYESFAEVILPNE
jgi:ribonuclease T1